MKRKNLVAFLLFLSTVTVSCDDSKSDISHLYRESNISAAEAQRAQMDVANSRQNAITRAVEKCRPAIVGINITEVRQVVYQDPFFDFPFADDPFFQRFREFFGGGQRKREYKVQGLGSGFIISPDGYILTNHHVAGNATKIVVTMTNGEKYDAEIIGSDMVSDVALLKIDGKNLPYLELGNSDNVIVGEWAIAFGNPFGLFDKNAKPTVTVGVISNTNVSFIQEDRPQNRVYRNMLQTDAAISSGNSGGPLVNALGEVIGINTVIFSTAQSRSGAGSIGIGFAIPINRVKKIIDEIKKNKSIDRDFYIGMDVRDIDEQIAQYLKSNVKEGAVVFSVERRSPADKNGIEPGDVIIKVNDTNIHKAEDYYIEIGDSKVGDRITLELLRGDEKIKKTFKLEKK
jgi:serine protease Do